MRLRYIGWAAAGLSAFALALQSQSIRHAAGVLLQLSGAPVAASAARISEHEIEEINAMPPQDQVERLLERAINHYAGAAEEIERRANGWRGEIHTSERLENLTNTAYFASDLRVRAMALEIWLARDNLAKTSESVDELSTALPRRATGNGSSFRVSGSWEIAASNRSACSTR